MKRKKPWIWIPAIGLGAVVFWAVALVVAVALFPSIALNRWTVDRAGRWLRGNGVDVAWTSVGTEARSTSVLGKRLGLELGGFCFRSPGIEVCAARVRAVAEIALDAFPPRLVSVGPLEMEEGRLNLNPAEFPVSPEEPKAENEDGIPGFLAETRIEGVSIDLREFRVALAAPARDARGSLRLDAVPRGDGLRWSLRLDERLRGGPSAHRGRVSLSAEAPTRRWSDPPRGRLEARAEFDDGRKGGAELDLRTVGGGIAYRLEGRYFEGRKYARAEIAGDWGDLGGKALLRATARNFAPGLKRVSARDCALELERRGAKQARVTVDCPIDVWAEVPQSPALRRIPEMELPTRSTATLSADVTTAFPPSADARVAGRAGVVVDPILTPLLRSDSSRVTVELDGVPSRFPRGWKLDTGVDVRLRVPELAQAVKRLETTPWAIPAPLNTLAGSILLESRGRADLAATGGRIPIRLVTRLASDARAAQRLDLDGAGAISVTRTPKPPELGRGEQAGRTEPELGARLDFKLALSDVQLAAPRIDLAKPPRLFPDSRVTTRSAGPSESPEEEAASTAFEYDVRITTPEARPIRILSDRTETPVPIYLDVHAESGEPVSGTVRVSDFRLERFFRLKARLERLKVDFVSEGPSKGRVDGLFRMELTDYLIRLAIEGPVEQPTYRFWSEPPLPEDQVFAALLFGRPMEELDPDQAESAENFRQATALNRGLGLASFFLFASTPIESVGLDPESGQVDVRVRLAKGTSLTLGGNRDAPVSSVGVRRRLSRFWTLTTEFANASSSSAASSDSTRALSTFLEWSRRY